MTAPKIVIHRERNRQCGACARHIVAGVWIGEPDKPPRSVHFLFCRTCARRIGTVGAAIGRAAKRVTKGA